MDQCRICLANNSEKDIFLLETGRNGDKKCFVDVFMFCLNIQVVKDSKISSKLCLKCYKKVISFHKFKCLALKNDAFLKSSHEEVEDNNGNEPFIIDDIKAEPLTLSDESQDNQLKDELKDDVSLKNEDSTHDYDTEDEFLSVIKKIKYEYVEDDTDTKEYGVASQKRRKKIKSTSIKSRKKTDSSNTTQICEECGKTVKDLKSHAYLHLPASDRKRIKCKLCDKTFATHSARYKHNKTKHLGIKQKCPLCDKVVTYIKQHQRLVHFRSTLPFQCVPCGQRFISKSSLDVHMTTHTKDRPFDCSECDKKFSTRALMVMHKRQVHDKEKSHLCQLCSKSFFKRYHLQVHLRSHSKEKPYECPDCGKFFSNTTTMKSHREIHNVSKNYACTLCDMTFKKKNYLSAHMISHTKEKRYPCQYCGVAFHRSDHRKRHERTAHEQHLAVS